MSRTDKYERLYQTGRGICGAPFEEFEAFFEAHVPLGATVLNLGCGQGRDALFIARRGHRVLGVDLSPTGVAQMLEDAGREGLVVAGVVADIVTYEPPDEYDVVLLDRVLHMLEHHEARRVLLDRACRHTRKEGFLLIADTPKHIPFIADYFSQREATWRRMMARKGFVFLHKEGITGSVGERQRPRA